MKNEKMLSLVIILSILVVGLGGYIVYDKVLSLDNDSNGMNNDLDNNNTVNENYVTGYFEDLISASDVAKLDDSINYKNIDITINDLSFIFNCIGFGGAPGNYCYTTEMLLGGNQVNKSDNVVGDLNSNPYLIITDNYFIIHRTDYQEIEIFDRIGNSLKKVENVVHSYLIDGDELYTKKPMYLDDNKLYFYDFSGFDGEPYQERIITLKYIDLLQHNFEVIKTNTTFKGKVACFEC